MESRSIRSSPSRSAACRPAAAPAEPPPGIAGHPADNTAPRTAAPHRRNAPRTADPAHPSAAREYSPARDSVSRAMRQFSSSMSPASTRAPAPPATPIRARAARHLQHVFPGRVFRRPTVARPQHGHLHARRALPRLLGDAREIRSLHRFARTHGISLLNPHRRHPQHAPQTARAVRQMQARESHRHLHQIPPASLRPSHLRRRRQIRRHVNHRRPRRDQDRQHQRQRSQMPRPHRHSAGSKRTAAPPTPRWSSCVYA